MAIPMRSGNPALTTDTFSRAPAMPGTETMTLGGTVNKALSLFSSKRPKTSSLASSPPPVASRCCM